MSYYDYYEIYLENIYEGHDDNESPYAGTYVHDVEGWSDEDIDAVLDGDPDAYWNID